MNRIERVGRGIVATAFAILFAALSHVAAGAQTPSLYAIGATIVVALPLSVALAGVRLSLARLSVIVVASQALFHFSFAMIAAPAANVVADSPHSGHSLGTMNTVSGGLPEASSTAVMWVAHAIAALATIVVLAFGERAAVALVTIVRAAFAALRSFVLSFSAEWPTLGAPVSADAHPIALRTIRTHARRGPPPLFV